MTILCVDDTIKNFGGAEFCGIGKVIPKEETFGAKTFLEFAMAHI